MTYPHRLLLNALRIEKQIASGKDFESSKKNVAVAKKRIKELTESIQTITERKTFKSKIK